LFRVMTVTRPEIYIEVLSSDSVWHPIVFNYKPVEPSNRPKFFFPHMPRIDWQMWFEALYFERLIDNPFALSAYQRFLETMVAEDLKMGEVTINNFIKNEDRKILDSLPFTERQKFTNNLEQSINSHLKNSYWFVRFLSKLGRLDQEITQSLQLDNISDIKSLRISLYQYAFNNGSDSENDWWKIDSAKSPSIVIDLK